jgi:uncharacterized protein
MGRDGEPHYPRPAPIEGYGNGGFSFAGMSHRGSLLCLPSGIWAWPITQPHEITEVTLAPLFAEAADVGFFLLGTGREAWDMPSALRRRFHELKLTVEVTRTGMAISTFNLLLEEGRRVAAGLVAVG